jgi:signal transduction histidine kinase
MTQEKSASLTAPQVNTQKQLGPRTVLFAGFGALLILMGIISVDSLGTLRVIEASDAQIRRDSLFRERTLEQVRSGLYESGNIVRDYLLLESGPSTPEALRGEFQSVRNGTSAGLKACIQSLPTEKRQPFQHLTEELDRYWSTLAPVFEWDEKEKQQRGPSFLRSEMLSQHGGVLQIAQDVSAVNEAELKESETKVAAVFVQFRRRLQTATLIAFGLGFILAAATILYTARLEKSAQERFNESRQAHRELKDLSKRLLDAHEQERRAISRELHDEVGQSLSALLMDVENLAANPGRDGALRNGLKNIKMIAENCVNEIRDMALLLRPSMLDDLGLVAAIEWQAREVSKRTGMLVSVVAENVSDLLPEEHKTCVYRIVQEALNNCSKHAYSRNARVNVREEPGHLLLTIEDDGKGFNPSHTRGLGLVGMNERVVHLGGVLQVDSVPGRGTCLRVNLPLTMAAAGVNEVTP